MNRSHRTTVWVIPLHFHDYFHRLPAGETAHPNCHFAEAAPTGRESGFLCLLFSIRYPISILQIRQLGRCNIKTPANPRQIILLTNLCGGRKLANIWQTIQLKSRLLMHFIILLCDSYTKVHHPCFLISTVKRLRGDVVAARGSLLLHRDVLQPEVSAQHPGLHEPGCLQTAALSCRNGLTTTTDRYAYARNDHSAFPYQSNLYKRYYPCSI